MNRDVVRQLDGTQNAKLATSEITLGAVDNSGFNSKAAYSPELNLIVMVSQTGTNRIAVSNNGTTWTLISVASLTTATLRSCAWSPTLRMFVIVGNNVILYSYDGYNWTFKLPPANIDYRQIQWISEKGFFLVCSSNSVTANRFIKSTDGINWTGYSAPSTLLNGTFTYSPSLDLFVTANFSSNSIWYSSNGETWSSRTIPLSSSWNGICWSKELNLFVMVSSTAISNNILTSPDAITWTSRTKSTTSALLEVIYSPELKMFIAGGGSAVNINKFYTSTDGIRWTAQSYTDSRLYRGVAWIKELGKFIFGQETNNVIATTKNIYQPYNLISLNNFVQPAITYRGNTASTTTTATVSIPTGSLQYQWEKSTDNGVTFTNVGSATTPALTLTQTERNTSFDNNEIYRLKVTSSEAKYPISYIGRYVPTIQEDNVYAVNNHTTTTISDSSWHDATWSSKRGLFIAASFGGTNRLGISANGSTWTYVDNTNNINTVFYSENLSLFIAGGSNLIRTSVDGINWTARTSPVNQVWRHIAYSSSLGRFVVVSQTTTSNAVATSTDGITWTSSTTGITQAMWGIAWSPSLALFAAVGNAGTIITSTNGTTWVTRTAPNTNNYVSIAWSPTLGMFAAVANTGTGNRVMTSVDGITWVAGVSTADVSWRKIIWSDDLGMFIASSETAAINGLMYSTNGTTWVQAQIPNATQKGGLAWSQDLKRLITVASSGTGTRGTISSDIFTNKNTVAAFTQVPALTSKTYVSNTTFTLSSTGSVSNGDSPSYQWQESTDGGSTWNDLSGENNSSLNLNGPFVAGTKNYRNQIKNVAAINTPLNTEKSELIIQSDNLYKVDNFTAINPGVARSWNGLAYSPSLNLLVAVANGGTGNRIMTSSDGITWVARASTDDTATWEGVEWSPELALFVAVAQSGQIMTSTDGITWTARTAPAAQQWRNVAWSPSLGLFAAVAIGGTGNRIMTSPDGINWTLRTNTQVLYDIVWSANQAQFVAVGSNAVATSSDGITWTTRTPASAFTWRSVTYSPSLNLFVAVADGGTSRVMTSTNGITWTLRTTNSNNWWGIAWSEELGYFVACATSGTLDRLMYSSNGINWTTTTSINQSIIEIIWASGLGRFVACSFDGTNQIHLSATIP